MRSRNAHKTYVKWRLVFSIRELKNLLLHTLAEAREVRILVDDVPHVANVLPNMYRVHTTPAVFGVPETSDVIHDVRAEGLMTHLQLLGDLGHQSNEGAIASMDPYDLEAD